MENLCENCILYGSCDGRCGDTDPLFYWEEEQNDSRDYLEKSVDKTIDLGDASERARRKSERE